MISYDWVCFGTEWNFIIWAVIKEQLSQLYSLLLNLSIIASSVCRCFCGLWPPYSSTFSFPVARGPAHSTSGTYYTYTYTVSTFQDYLLTFNSSFFYILYFLDHIFIWYFIIYIFNIHYSCIEHLFLFPILFYDYNKIYPKIYYFSSFLSFLISIFSPCFPFFLFLSSI